MILFSVVWTPLFFLFWRSLYGRRSGGEAAWGGITGIFIAAFRIILGPLIVPQSGLFELCLSAFIDYTSFAPLVAMTACAILPRFFRCRKSFEDSTLFMFAAYFTAAPAYAIAWSAFLHPLHLVLPPLLWTSAALAAGVFRRIWLFPHRHNIPNKRFVFAALAVLTACALLCANAASYIAFFFRQPLAGALFLIPALVLSASTFFLRFP